MIELAIVLVIVGIVAGMGASRIRFNRFEMDANARLIQNLLAGARQTAVQKGTQVLVVFDFNNRRVQVVEDTSGNATAESNERTVSRALSPGVNFLTPPATIDGATAAELTGAGVSGSGTTRTIRMSAAGGASGDAVIYLGTVSTRTSDYRAVQLTGSTTRTVFWRYTGTAWRQDLLR